MIAFTVGQSMAWPTPALTKVLNDEAGFTLSDDEIDYVVLLPTVASFIGPFLAGCLMDRIGRRNSLLLGSVVYIGSTFAIIFITDAVSLIIMRSLNGIWSGFSSTVTPLFLAEFLNSAQRDQMFSFYAASFMSGMLVQSISAFGDYFTVTLTSAVPSVLVCLFLLVTPETHYYFLMKNNKMKARQSIVWMKGSCCEKELEDLEKIVKIQIQQKSTIIEFFKNKSSRRAFCSLSFIWIIQRAGGFTLFTVYLFKFFPTNLLPNNINFVIFCVSLFVGALCPKLILNRIGGVLTLRYSLVFGASSLFTFGLWFFLEDKTSMVEGTEWILYVCLVILGVSISTTVAVRSKYQGELFPMNLKVTGSVLSYAISSLTSVLVTKTYSPFVYWFGIYSNFIFGVIMSILGIAFTFSMMETKGRTLEEIQDDLKNKTKEDS